MRMLLVFFTISRVLRLTRLTRLDRQIPSGSPFRQVVSGRTMPTATVKLLGPDGMPKVYSAVGTGPVDAAYKAVNMAMQLPVELLKFEVASVTEGIDALAVCKVPPRCCTYSESAPNSRGV
eukprot:1809438-Pyramimonas_sp.AAC.1